MDGDDEAEILAVFYVPAVRIGGLYGSSVRRCPFEEGVFRVLRNGHIGVRKVRFCGDVVAVN